MEAVIIKMIIEVCEDDPGLTVVAEVSDTPDFAVIDQIIGIETDPDTNDGFKTLTFIDTEIINSTNQRFMRLRFSVGQ